MSATPPFPAGAAMGRPWFDTPRVRLVVLVAAALGFAMGVETLVLHLSLDPLADVRAYYDAGARLNAGVPLYQQTQGVGVNDPGFYRYPPLLAIAFRPLAALPYTLAAGIWEGVVLLAFALTITRLGAREKSTWVVTGLLALPIVWTLTIGQAQALVTMLLAIRAPWSLAVATHLKLFPALAAVWWVGRREWGSLARFLAWTAGLGILQLALAPAATLAYPAFLSTDQVGAVMNVSPYIVSPVLWAVVLALTAVAAVRFAGSPLGWPLAVILAVLASPRLLVYQASSLMAAVTSRKRSG